MFRGLVSSRGDGSVASPRERRIVEVGSWLVAAIAVVSFALAVTWETALPLDPVGPETLALTAGSGPSRSAVLDRLTEEIRSVVETIDETDEAGALERRDVEIDLEVDGDEQLAELSGAVDDLTALLYERRQRLVATERDRRTIDRLVADGDAPSGDIIEAVLEVARERLALEAGVAARVAEDGDGVRIRESESESAASAAVPEAQFRWILRERLFESTDESVVFTSVDDGYHSGSPDEEVEWYVGGRIEVDGELQGGVCFVGHEPRDAITPSERSFLEFVCRRLGRVFEREEYERKRRFKERVLEAAPIGITITDPRHPDDPIVYANDAFEEMTGYAESECRGRNCRFLQGRETDSEAVRELREAIAAAEPTTVELRNYRKDGSEFWNRVSVAPIEDDQGAVVNFVEFQEDVTERKERAQELRKQKRKLSSLMSNVPGIVYRCRNEPAWPFEFVSEGATELTGYEPEALVEGDVHWAEDVLVGDNDELWHTIQEAVSGRDPYQVTYQIETADGDRRWLSEQGHGVFDEENLDHLEGVVIDITPQVESKRELRRTRALLEQSQRVADVGGWELGVTDGQYDAQWSAQTARIHGVDPGADIDYERLVEYYHPDDRPKLERAIERALEDGESYDLELRIDRPDGDRRWVRAIGEPIVAGRHTDHDDHRVLLRGSVQDITDQKERERELERTRALLEQSQRVADVGGWELDVSEEPSELEWTDETARIYGLDADFDPDLEAALGYYSPDDRSHVEQALERAIEEGKSYDLELQLVRDDGERRWVRAIGEPVVEDGGVVAVRGSIQDVTDQKEREKDLERTQAFLERIQQMASIGGWELDLRTEPREATWTEELYRIHGMQKDAEPDLAAAIDQYHPDDRDDVWKTLETAIENETVYDLEARMQPTADDLRWVRGFGAPVFDDGELVKYQGALQEITGLKRRELALESLHEATRRLLGAETVDEVADQVVAAAEDVLEAAAIALYGLDSDVNRLVPISHTDAFDQLSSDDPSTDAGNSDSVLWNVFATGAQTVVDDPEAFDRSDVFENGIESAVVVPIGDHGVFTVASRSGLADAEARRLIETLVATAEAAFDRLESEASLRERDAELEARNRHLRRQITVTETIRRINQSLIGAASRDEIERTVPERLVENDDIAFAWIATAKAEGGPLDPRSYAGSHEDYLDAISLGSATSSEPAARTVRTGETTVVENVVDQLQQEPWRKQALDAGFQSAISVPLAVEEYSYGVLTVYATAPDAFTSLERTVFSELGEAIANAITATETREALHAETAVELTLEVNDSSDVLSRIASVTDARVEYEGLGTHSGEETLLFFETRGVEPEAVTAVLEGLVSVSQYRLLSVGERDGDDEGDTCRFETLVTGSSVASQLVRYGGSPRSIRANGDETVVTVDVPTGADVREFAEMLTEQYGEADLLRRRHVERPMYSRRELVDALFESLTDRQLEVLRTAYFAGFFEWPRESTGQEVAEMLEVSQPTVNRHLRVGQGRLFAQLFEEEPTSLESE
ncbi:PAS domain-containing protein [Natronobacterium gregoryi]|uniref:histidine kinase n=2 Tax=Natronobacterium gregoryi TaxID=44930 RepID=L0AIG8_NATGS|nr:PAS domain-containing protein [Natronobacterium gregoryi]AFZ72972.1 PAS domain S-box [Natronobacterium gregoryi SP2]ELY69880.1 PAS/PAC sensor protein [Natronobacterium gregoryi SP2]PLK21805.1 PAS domain S-box protein [Natronobacterium gregoryi SP2]SFI68820.1 PAS domain S-box-containing protein [Natronobacterium gregoryi]